jgi:hypothetical protein
MTIAEKLAALGSKKDAAAEDNRRSMPIVAAFVDEMKAAFGADQIRVTYAFENGREVGKKDTQEGFPVSKMLLFPTKKHGGKK